MVSLPSAFGVSLGKWMPRCVANAARLHHPSPSPAVLHRHLYLAGLPLSFRNRLSSSLCFGSNAKLQPIPRVKLVPDQATMASSPLQTQLKAPNGVDITLPTGLFINNEFVPSSSGKKITSISPM
ncbi:hypothetical protein HIM_05213 [Hirsutella minnesotensis 3608]|uniref:Uncharacterized protein n=1 Tax=Hirsutella minnesotensis 3608 TaxID=1043627 RepID=A0A0F8A0F5_9HYPO|nr:hypothetical protein HIM_05213 [Hirsutella minnesotensis 3608]